MKIFASLALALLLFPFAALAQSAPPPAAVYSTEPFSSGTFFSTTQCGTQRFACSPSLARDQMTARANICASETYGLNNIMGEIGTIKNGYKGCVLPTTYVTDKTGSKKWTICCVAPAKTGNMCTFDCHLYFSK